jgi:DNA-binding CsgD family transcriptional regulator
MQLRGAWRDAVEEARRACEHLNAEARPVEPGAAHYQLAELRRLQGDFKEAEDAYRLASQAGRKPQPGLSLLRLAQGQVDAADAAIRLALRETRAPRARVHVLAAAVEIMLAKGDRSAARAAADELSQRAEQLEAPFPRAVASQAAGAVAVCDEDAEAALTALDIARTIWQELDVPYELARVRMQTGLAYRNLGDEDGAQLEFDAALEAFERLGAGPDVKRLSAIAATADPPSAAGLTGREIEVLRLIATGATNRAIAARLGISEKTVARHLSNIFTKLDLPSRSAATAYAYEHKLV